MTNHGFRTAATNLGALYRKIENVKESIQAAADMQYHRLLGKEVALWTDLVSLNAVQINDLSIYEHSIRSLAQKMLIAQGNSIDSPYNMQTYVHLVYHKDYAYINVICCQKEFLKAFKMEFLEYGFDAPSEQDIHLDDNNRKKKIKDIAERTKTWKAIEDEHKDGILFGIDITPSIEPDPKKLRFPDINERIDDMARYQMMGKLMGQLSNGQQIPPYLLMPMFDEIVETATRPAYRKEMTEMRMKSAPILINIEENWEAIEGRPDAVEKTPTETPEEP